MTRLLQDYVSQQADLRPEATAVVGGGVALTYGELEVRSNQLAHALRAQGCEPGDRVCVLGPKCTESIVAILAIYKSDCIYVPLDPGSPAPRLSKMIASAEPRCILAMPPVQALLDAIVDTGVVAAGTRIGWLDDNAVVSRRFRSGFDLRHVAWHSQERVCGANLPDAAAHLLFTSGSTGTPKGVVITHANVIAFVDWSVRYFKIDASDRNSGHPPLHFDLSMLDIFATFAAGASLYLVPAELNLFPNKVAAFIRHNELTQWFSVPSLLTYMANMDAVAPNDFPSLKRLLWCGEVLATPSLAYWMQRLPHVTFTNLYGPTEATIASSYYTVTSVPNGDAQIPIGYPCDGESLHVLDATLQPVGAGEIGDLYIGGVGLSPGYWRNAEATAAAFVHRHLKDGSVERLYRTGDLASVGTDGEVYFHGRADSQIKSRGHRVELGEIEAAVGAFDEVHDCAVVAIPSTHFEGHTICCAYVPSRYVPVSAAQLRKKLSTKLPVYMIPGEWLELHELPKNGNGKVDRPFLRTEFQNRKTVRHEQPTQ